VTVTEQIEQYIDDTNGSENSRGQCK
jgi:hypothetical protein